MVSGSAWGVLKSLVGGAQHVKLLVGPLDAEVIFVKHHSRLRIHGEVLGVGYYFLHFPAGRDEGEVAGQQGGSDIKFVQRFALVSFADGSIQGSRGITGMEEAPVPPTPTRE